MKRKDYRKPTILVVKLQHTEMLQTSVNRQSYGIANEGVDKKELDNKGVWTWY